MDPLVSEEQTGLSDLLCLPLSFCFRHWSVVQHYLCVQEQLLEWPPAFSAPSCHFHSSLFAAHYTCNMLENLSKLSHHMAVHFGKAFIRRLWEAETIFSLLTSAETLLWTTELHSLNMSEKTKSARTSSLYKYFLSRSFGLSLFGQLYLFDILSKCAAPSLSQHWISVVHKHLSAKEHWS